MTDRTFEFSGHEVPKLRFFTCPCHKKKTTTNKQTKTKTKKQNKTKQNKTNKQHRSGWSIAFQ